jgi:hypothetical protein
MSTYELSRNVITMVGLMDRIKARRNRGKGGKQKEKPTESKGTQPQVKLEEVFEAPWSKTTVGLQERAYLNKPSATADIRQIHGMTISRPIMTNKKGKKKIYGWYQTPSFNQPSMSNVQVCQEMIPETKEWIREICSTTGRQQWLFARMKEQMPPGQDLNVFQFILPHQEADLKHVAEAASEIAEMLPVKKAEYAILNEVMDVLRVSSQEEVMAMLTQMEVTYHASTGMPYERDYPGKAKYEAVDKLTEAQEEMNVEIYDRAATHVRMMTTGPKAYQEYLSQDSKKHPEQYVLLLKRKGELYQRSKMKKKIRPYYVYPAHINLALRLFTDVLRHARANCQEVPGSISAYGFSWIEGGAARLVATLKHPQFTTKTKFATCTYAMVCFSDDAVGRLTVTDNATKAQKVFYVEADLSAADMHYTAAASTLEYLIHRKHVSKENTPVFRAFWTLLTESLFGGHVAMGGVNYCQKYRGLNSGHVWTTPVGIVNHVAWVRKMIGGIMTRLASLPSKRLNSEEVRQLFLAAPKTCKLQCVYKTVVVTEVGDEKSGCNLFTFLGRTVYFDTKWKKFDSKMPLKCLVQSLCTPTALTDANAAKSRVVGLAIASGGHYPSFQACLQTIFNRSPAADVDPKAAQREVNTPGFPELAEAVSELKGTLPDPNNVRRFFLMGKQYLHGGAPKDGKQEGDGHQISGDPPQRDENPLSPGGIVQPGPGLDDLEDYLDGGLEGKLPEKKVKPFPLTKKGNPVKPPTKRSSKWAPKKPAPAPTPSAELDDLLALEDEPRSIQTADPVDHRKCQKPGARSKQEDRDKKKRHAEILARAQARRLLLRKQRRTMRSRYLKSKGGNSKQAYADDDPIFDDFDDFLDEEDQRLQEMEDDISREQDRALAKLQREEAQGERRSHLGESRTRRPRYKAYRGS